MAQSTCIDIGGCSFKRALLKGATVQVHRVLGRDAGVLAGLLGCCCVAGLVIAVAAKVLPCRGAAAGQGC